MTTQASPGYHSGPNVSAFTTIGKGIDSNIMDSTSGSTSSGSHVIANINKKAPSNPRHIRQNFGKDRGYIPPDAMNAHLRLSATETPVKSKVHTAERPVQVTPEERSSDNDNEMPFDVLNSMIIRDRSTGISQAHQRTPPEPASPPLTNSQMVEDDGYFSPISTRECESVWESSPEREESKHRQDLSQKIDQLASPGGRFELRPPKFSDPLPLYVNDDMERSIKGMNDMVDQLGAIAEEARSYSFSPQNVPEPCDYEELGFSSNAIGTNEHPELPLEGSNPEDEDSVFDFQEEQRRVSPQFPGSQERPVNITHKIRRRTRKTKQLDAENEDDTSLEFSYGPAKSGSPTNLSERAQQAWRSRREKHSSSLRSKQDPRRTKPEKVSFGASDTVHTFEPDIPESDEDDDTIPSFEDRSLNSEYTKTLESEVEDMIKDILFIGNGTASKPGRRKLKHKHEVKRKLRQLQKENQGETSLEQVDEDVAGEETSSLDRVGEESTKASTSHDAFQTPRTSQGSRSKSKGKNKQPKKASKQNDEDDPLGFVWDFVSGGVGAVTNVLGIATDEAPPSDNTAGEQATVNRKSSSRKRGSVENKEDEFGCTDFLEVITGETCGGKVTPTQEPKEGMQKMMDDAQDYWYGPIGESGSYVSITQINSTFPEDSISHSLFSSAEFWRLWIDVERFGFTDDRGQSVRTGGLRRCANFLLL